MKAGEKVLCPACNQETFAKEETILEDWTVKEKILKCALCGSPLGAPCDSDDNTEQVDQKNEKLSALADFLGGDETEKFEHNISQEVRRFCKDCKHFIEHPFHTRCAVWDKIVDPMDDCEKFVAKESKTSNNIDK